MAKGPSRNPVFEKAIWQVSNRYPKLTRVDNQPHDFVMENGEKVKVAAVYEEEQPHVLFKLAKSLDGGRPFWKSKDIDHLFIVRGEKIYYARISNLVPYIEQQVSAQAASRTEHLGSTLLHLPLAKLLTEKIIAEAV